MNGKIAKEVFIIILLIIVVMFTIGILFYEFIPSNDEKISSIEYNTNSDVMAILDEIQPSTGGDNSNSDSTNTLLKSYTINKNDLSGYQSDNYYESGKKDPFAEYSERVDSEVVSVTNTMTVDSSKTNDDKNNSQSNTDTQKPTNTVEVNKKDNENNTIKNEDKEIKNNNTVDNTKNQNTTGTYFEKKGSK